MKNFHPIRGTPFDSQCDRDNGFFLPCAQGPSTIPAMTCCIGVLCEERRAVVLVGDRDLTLMAPIWSSTETDRRKIQAFSSHGAIAYSGAPSELDEVVANVAPQLHGKTPEAIAEEIKSVRWRIRDRRVEEAVLRSQYALTFDEYKQMVVNTSSQLAVVIAKEVEKNDLAVDVMFVAFCDGKAELFTVTREGVNRFDEVGYIAIGSGKLFAYTHIVFTGYKRTASLPEAILVAYESKKASEVSVGVGEFTDVGILTEHSLEFLPDAAVDELEKLRESRKRPKFPESDLAAVRNLLPSRKES